jgi:hypothetical protein
MRIREYNVLHVIPLLLKFSFYSFIMAMLANEGRQKGLLYENG